MKTARSVFGLVGLQSLSSCVRGDWKHGRAGRVGASRVRAGRVRASRVRAGRVRAGRVRAGLAAYLLQQLRAEYSQLRAAYLMQQIRAEYSHLHWYNMRRFCWRHRCHRNYFVVARRLRRKAAPIC